MKKILFFIGILFATATIFSACEGPMGPPGKDGLNGEGVNWDIIPFTVMANQWIRKTDQNGLNGYYYASINVPEITNFIATKGLALCYLVDGDVQIVLPSVRHYENAYNERWTQTIDFDIAVGGIFVYVTNSDFFDERPSKMDFSLRLIW
ncbi:MAG: hypothetical protein FWF72_00335 [Paludibacter sp.]|nr:hypothetical protein [Paludibacter sp.]